jgi:hypothetical protein
MNPWIVLPAIVALAVVYVMLPTGLLAFFRYRLRKLLRCPRTGEGAQVRFDSGWAGLSAALTGHPSLRVSLCSLWPERSGCGRECQKLPATEVRA